MKHIDLSDVSDLSISLENLDERIALEAGFISGIATAIRDAVPNLIFNAKKLFANIKKLDKHDLRFLDVNYTVLERLMGDDTFVNISELPVVVPEGMSSNLFDVCEAVKKLVAYSNNTLPRLQDYSRFIAGIISSADGRKSLNDYSGIMKTVDKERDQVTKPYNDCFQAGSTKAIREYGSVVENNKMWLSCYQSLTDSIEDAKKFKLVDIENSINEITMLLDNLNERIKSGTVLDMSTETLRTLSAMTVTVAREVELYGITMYRLSEVKKCYEISSKDLLKALKG